MSRDGRGARRPLTVVLPGQRDPAPSAPRLRYARPVDARTLALSVTLAALGCAPAAPAAPSAPSATSPALPPPSPPTLREGIVLPHAANPRLHPLDGALLVS